MAIPIAKEDAELFKIFRAYENCFFCNDKTDTWHEKTNNPVCDKCAKKHKVAELPNRLKKQKRINP